MGDNDKPTPGGPESLADPAAPTAPRPSYVPPRPTFSPPRPSGTPLGPTIADRATPAQPFVVTPVVPPLETAVQHRQGPPPPPVRHRPSDVAPETSPSGGPPPPPVRVRPLPSAPSAPRPLAPSMRPPPPSMRPSPPLHHG